MRRAVQDSTAIARSLIAGVGEGDIRLACDRGSWTIVPASSPGSKGRPAEYALVEELIGRGLLERQGTQAVPTARGKRFAGLAGSGAPAAMPAGRNGRAKKHKPPRKGASQCESPLEWLHRRKAQDGRPLVGKAAFDAGERLRADYTRSGLMPRISPDLTAAVPGKGRKAGARGPADIADAALDARDRVNRALEAVGCEMSGLLVDVCCHLKSLGDAERERGWPKRSAKVVLDMGLSRLARHYGMADAATGRRATGRIHHWGSDGYRPGIG